MSQQLINLGSVANDGTGNPLRTGGSLINANFTELYQGVYPVRNVLAYGAVGDGIADDTAAWKAAIAAVGTAGGVVYGPAGVYLLSDVLTIPTDRLVALVGVGDVANNNGAFGGTILRAVGGFAPTDLIAQTGGAATHPGNGLQIKHLVLDGNNGSMNLLHITNMQAFRIDSVTFYRSGGNGLLLTGGCFNFHITQPRFFEIGNTTAYPNGTSAFACVSTADGASVDGWITQPHFESGRGSYFTSYDPTGTNPHSGIVWLGGKMEWSGNASLGLNPSAGIGMPFVVPGNLSQSQFRGLMCVNGYANAAWHFYIQNCSQCVFDSLHVTTIGLADAQLPTYYVNYFSGTNNRIQGNYIRGAASGTSGAHIRVTGTGAGVTIDPTNMYVSPASGTAVHLDNLATNNPGALTVAQQISRPVVAVTYNAALAVNAAVSDYQKVTLTGNTTVGIPTNPVAGQRLTLLIIQDGTGGRTVAWNAVFKNSWSDTGNTLNKRSSISHVYDGTNWNQDGAQSPYV